MAQEDNLDNEEKELLENLSRAEKTRRAKALTFGFAIVAALTTLGVLAVLFTDTFFQPELDISGGEEDVLAKTNDPECRGFIERITAIEADYRSSEGDVEGIMKTDNVEELRDLHARVGGLRERIDRQEEASQDAELRFDESRAELDAWFKYIDNELSLVQDLVAWRLAELGSSLADGSPAESAGGAGATAAGDSDAGASDAGQKSVVHVKAKTVGHPTGAARVEASNKKPKELHEGSMLAVHEAFQSFRVWHTGSLHPCGKAGEGETPWSPGGSAATNDSKNEKS